MISTLFSTEFIGTAQNMSLESIGNKYGISFWKGGYKYDGTELETEHESVSSGRFDNYEDAFYTYAALLKEFGRGNYSFEDRKEMVANCKGNAE